MRTYSLLLLTAALCLAACDSSSDADEPLVAPPGRFSADVVIDGAGAVSFDGFASATNSGFFVDYDSLYIGDDSLFTGDSLRSTFMITLGAFEGPGRGQFISLTRQGERPETGTYALDDFDRDAFFAFYVSPSGSGFPSDGDIFAAESGTVTIERSSDQRVAGRFDFRARSFGLGEGEENGRTATVRGAFDAAIQPLPEGFPRGMSGG
jgi:hypothetical protein